MKVINILVLAASASAFNLRSVLDNVDNFLRDDTSLGQSNNELRRPTQISAMGPPPISRPNTGYGGYRSLDDYEEKVNRVTRYLRSDPLALKAVSAFVERMEPEERSYSANNAPTGSYQRPSENSNSYQRPTGGNSNSYQQNNGGYNSAPYQPQQQQTGYSTNPPPPQAYRPPDDQDSYGKVTRALRNLIDNLDQEL